MLSANNLLRPQDGGPVTVPTQDMVLGSYYLTYEKYPEHTAEETYDDVAAVKPPWPRVPSPPTPMSG